MIRVLPLIALLGLVACSKSSPAAANASSAVPSAAVPSSAVPASTAGAQAGAAQVAPPQPVPAQLPAVVARVNGETITKADFDEAVKELEAGAGQPVPADQRDQVFRGVLDQLIGYRLLLQETKARKIAVTDADLDARIGEIRKQFPSEEAFKQVLGQRGLTLERLRGDARNDLAVTKMLQAELGAAIAVKPEQVTEFYTQNPSQFQQGERVRASHILIGFPENADAAAKTQARTKAAEILKEVKAGKDFAGLAKQHSSDPGSAQNGGDLGFFQKGQMVPPFDQAAFTMKPGETSDLVETNFGYHIIRVAAHEASRTVPLDDVRPQIEQYLGNQNRQMATQGFVESLKAKGKVEVYI